MKHDNDMTAKRTIRTVLYSAALPLTLAALAACTENDAAGGSTDADALALRTITVSISDGSAATRTADGPATHAAGSATRAAGSDDSHAPTGSATYGSFATDEKIYCFMPEGRSRLSAVYTVSGGAARVSDGGEPLMASQHATLDVYAYAPCDKGGVSVNEHTASFTVQQDQTTQLALLQSDLLYAAGTVAPKANHITNAAGTTTALTFSHQLSKLVLQPYATGAATVTGARIVSGYRTTELTINVGQMQTPAATDKHSDPITTGSPLTVYSDNTGFAAPAAAAGATSAQALVCIVPPQTFAAGESLVQLDVEGIGTITYAIGSTAQTLAAGSAYLVPLPISATTGTVSVTNFTTVPWSYGDDAATHEYTSPRSHQYTVTAADGTPVTFDMVYVEGGPNNGATLNNQTCTYTLTDFYMGKTEVTNALWEAVMGWRPTVGTSGTLHMTTNAGDLYPVSGITYDEINDFLIKLNKATASQHPGYAFCLPTEAQWEYAARGGRYALDDTHSYAGTTATDAATLSNYIWHKDNTGTTSQPVGQLLPNELGLYDMCGNVWEMIRNTHNVTGHNPTGRFSGDLGTDPTCETSAGTNALCKGGSYDNDLSESDNLKIFYTLNNRTMVQVWNTLGFRLCMEPRPIVGDFYFNDGTYGTLASNTSGATKTIDDVIGIVFSNQPSAADRAAGYTHGYVLSLCYAANGVETRYWSKTGTVTGWGKNDKIYTGTTIGNTTAENYNLLIRDMDGLTHCNTAYSTNGNSWAGLNAMYMANEYGSSTDHPVYAAPATSSGWYLPSSGQVYECLKNFSTSMANHTTYFSSVYNASGWALTSGNGWKQQCNNNLVFNAWNAFVLATGLPDAGAVEENSTTAHEHQIITLSYGRYFWTSTEVSATAAYYLHMSNGASEPGIMIEQNGTNAGKVNPDVHVRPVLAF